MSCLNPFRHDIRGIVSSKRLSAKSFQSDKFAGCLFRNGLQTIRDMFFGRGHSLECGPLYFYYGHRTALQKTCDACPAKIFLILPVKDHPLSEKGGQPFFLFFMYVNNKQQRSAPNTIHIQTRFRSTVSWIHAYDESGDFHGTMVWFLTGRCYKPNRNTTSGDSTSTDRSRVRQKTKRENSTHRTKSV